MADETRPKGGLDFTLEGAAAEPDDPEPRVLRSASIRPAGRMGRRGFMRGATAAGAGIAASMLACGGGDGNSRESQLAKTCDRRILLSHAGAVTALAFAPGGQRLATASADGTVKVWNAATGELLLRLAGHVGQVNAVAYSPDGAYIASGGADHTARIWNAADGAPLLGYAGHAGEVRAVAFFPDARNVASGSADGSVQIWDAATGALALQYLGHSSGAQVTCVAVSPDGTRVASGATDSTVRVWGAADGAALLTYTGNSHALVSVAFFPDGTRIASGGSYAFDGVQIWDAVTGVRLVAVDMSVSGYGSEAIFVAVSPDGAAVAAGDWSGGVQVLGASDGTKRFSCGTSQRPVLAVAFSPDGGCVASAGEDQCALVWNASSGAAMAAMTDPSLEQTSSDSGRTSCDGTGTIRTPACTCDEVCSCDPLCTCDKVCTCDSEGGEYWYPN